MKAETPPLSKSQRKKATRETVKRNQDSKQKKAKQSWAWLSVGLAGVIAAAVFFPVGMVLGKYFALIPPSVVPTPPLLNVIPQEHPPDDTLDLGHLLALKRNQLEGVDIAVLNLACSKGLPGCENVNIPAIRQLLDQWAAHVQEEIIRNHHRFDDNPASFYNSESYWKAAMMVTVLQQDMGIHYNLERMKDWSFTHGEDVLMNGLVGNLREGTCSSMPVLYVAIGRRLGWPLYLVAAKGHLFVRWESADGKVRFNIDGSGHGMNAYSDDFYKAWPYKLSSNDLWSGDFLRNMSGFEELACFLLARGNVLEALGRLPEAEEAYAQANALLPQNSIYFFNLAIGLEKDRMLANGLLDPKNPANPYRGKAPMPYEPEPSKGAFPDTVHDEGHP